MQRLEVSGTVRHIYMYIYIYMTLGGKGIFLEGKMRPVRMADNLTTFVCR
jgi:hypothetical protein